MNLSPLVILLNGHRIKHPSKYLSTHRLMEISDLIRDIFVHWIVVNPNDSLISLLILIVCTLVIIKNIIS